MEVNQLITARIHLHIAKVLCILGLRTHAVYYLHRVFGFLDEHSKRLGSTIYNRYFLMSFYGLSEREVRELYSFLYGLDHGWRLMEIYNMAHRMFRELIETMICTYLVGGEYIRDVF